jgi:hypothetical protein
VSVETSGGGVGLTHDALLVTAACSKMHQPHAPGGDIYTLDFFLEMPTHQITHFETSPPSPSIQIKSFLACANVPKHIFWCAKIYTTHSWARSASEKQCFLLGLSPHTTLPPAPPPPRSPWRRVGHSHNFHSKLKFFALCGKSSDIWKKCPSASKGRKVIWVWVDKVI